MNYIRDCYNNIDLPDGPFGFSDVQESQIMNILVKFDTNKAASIDGLSGAFLKDGAKILSKPITDLINLSISLSAVPESCKVAKLKPLFKKGSKLEPKNIIPISLLPLISKVLQKVIHDQTQNFLTDNSILYCYQYGFRKCHSTDTCFSYLNDKILKGTYIGLMTGLILIDVQKAFDTIDHEILFQKMVHLQFSAQSILWFRFFFSIGIFSQKTINI